MSGVNRHPVDKAMGRLSDKPKLLYLVGPTGVGKTAAALSIAASVRGEIVSADSMQVYRYMDIGTAKPTLEQRRRIPHHLIDLVDPDQPFNAARYREHANEAIRGVRSRGKNVVVCGGTGLYLKSLAGGLFRGPGRDDEIRRHLRESICRNGLTRLHEELRAVDPQGAACIDPHNQRRVIRAMEVFLLTGKPLSEWHRDHQFKEQPFEILKIGLHRPRVALYERINKRCEEMLRAGFREEVLALLDRGYSPQLPSLRSVGYRHLVQQLTGALGSDEAVALMQRDTRRLAKRQLTWFRTDTEIEWVPADDLERMKELCERFFGMSS